MRYIQEVYTISTNLNKIWNKDCIYSFHFNYLVLQRLPRL